MALLLMLMRLMARVFVLHHWYTVPLNTYHQRRLFSFYRTTLNWEGDTFSFSEAWGSWPFIWKCYVSTRAAPAALSVPKSKKHLRKIKTFPLKLLPIVRPSVTLQDIMFSGFTGDAIHVGTRPLFSGCPGELQALLLWAIQPHFFSWAIEGISVTGR